MKLRGILGLFLMASLGFCILAASGVCAVHNVTVSGQDKLYLSSIPPTANNIEQDTDPYYTMLYDDQTHVLAILGHRGLLPNGDAGQAYLYQLGGDTGGDRYAVEIARATINGIVYTDMNLAHGYPALTVTVGRRNGSATFNFFSVFCAEEPRFNLEGILQDINGDPDGIWDSIFIPEHDEPSCVGMEGCEHSTPDMLYDLNAGSQQRISADTGGGDMTFFTAPGVVWMGDTNPLFPPGEYYLSLNLPITTLEGQGGDMMLMEAGGEVLFAFPFIPAQFNEPPEPGFVGGGFPDPNPNANPESKKAYYHKDTDFWQQFCFIAATRNTGATYLIHKNLARLFATHRAYPLLAIAALAGLLGLLVSGLRRRGFGKDI